MVGWWHTQYDPASPVGAALNAGKSAVNTFLAQADIVLLAPVTGLIAGSVVFAARTRQARTEPEGGGIMRRLARVGAEVGRPVGGRIALFADGLRRVFQAGVVATMVFCLMFLLLGFVPAILSEPQRLLVGPQDFDLVWSMVSLPMDAFNNSVQLVLVMTLIAAFVDRTAARIARRAGTLEPAATATADPPPISPTPAPTALSAAFAAAVVPEQATTRLGPPSFGPSSYAPPAQTSYAPPPPNGPYTGPIVGAAPGTPSFGGISPVTATYTTPVQPPPTFGSAFAPPPALPPAQRTGQPSAPPAGPSATPPAGLTSGLWEDGKPDASGKPVEPGDDERGWSGFGR